MVFDLFSRQKQQREEFGDRLPPGQKLVEGWPVLSYGATPRIKLEDWRLRIGGLVEAPVELTWDEFKALPQTKITGDIHCVTHWSKFDNEWEGVTWQDLLKETGIKIKPEARHIMQHSYGGYTTNVPIRDMEQPGVIFAHMHNGKPLEPDHGGPMRPVVPHLYFWKSAKWLRGIEFMTDEKPGFWEMYGYHIYGDPWKEERFS
ncbi:MAG: sulfite oxidase-like oxidoreductase [Dehalococcoidia bacterium]